MYRSRVPLGGFGASAATPAFGAPAATTTFGGAPGGGGLFGGGAISAAPAQGGFQFGGASFPLAFVRAADRALTRDLDQAEDRPLAPLRPPRLLPVSLELRSRRRRLAGSEARPLRPGACLEVRDDWVQLGEGQTLTVSRLQEERRRGLELHRRRRTCQGRRTSRTRRQPSTSPTSTT